MTPKNGNFRVNAMVYVPFDWQTAPYKQNSVLIGVGMINNWTIETLKRYCFLELISHNRSALFVVCSFKTKKWAKKTIINSAVLGQQPLAECTAHIHTQITCGADIKISKVNMLVTHQTLWSQPIGQEDWEDLDAEFWWFSSYRHIRLDCLTVHTQRDRTWRPVYKL